jgi:hypothetical protein
MWKVDITGLKQLIAYTLNSVSALGYTLVLMQNCTLSALDSAGRYTNSLSGKLCDRAYGFCRSGQLLSLHETGTEEPDLKELPQKKAESVQTEVCNLEFGSKRSGIATLCLLFAPAAPIITDHPGLIMISASSVVRYLVMLLLIGHLPCVVASPIAEPIMGTFGKAAYLVLLAIGLLWFLVSKAHRCLCGGLSMLGLLFLPCAAFVDVMFTWCAFSFSFREYIHDERLMPKGMRDLHPVGVTVTGHARPSKRGLVWQYDGPHGTAEVRLFRQVGMPQRDVWEPQEFIAPAVAWVFYLDEFRDDEVLTMNAEACVKQLYWSLWIFCLGFFIGLISMGAAMYIAWMSSVDVGVRITGMCLAVVRGLVILWRWASDLFMSNHHRGAQLRKANEQAALFTNCRDYRRQMNLDIFPKAGLPQGFWVASPGNTPNRQVKILLHWVSQQMARLFQSWWLDWCASHYGVKLRGTTVKLDVQFDNKSHIVEVPKYVADGLRMRKGTIQPGRLAWVSMLVTAAYVGLVVTQIVLFTQKGVSTISAIVWGGATGFAIIVSAWLGGTPLVCSGIV